MTKSERWILSEWLVAKNRVLELNEELLSHRQKTPFGEIDLLLKGPSSLSVVEVKSWQGELWGESLVSRRQRDRLLRARKWVQETQQMPTALFLAVVSPMGEVDYFEAGSGWLLT